MKKVHTSDMVAHLWANRSQDEARTSNGSFYFTGPTIYSYGAHFAVGHITDWTIGDNVDNSARRVVLVNSRSYSTTTARHKSLAERALSRNIYTTFDISDITRDSVTSRRMALIIADQARADAMEQFEKALSYRADYKIKYALGEAHTSLELARIALANAPSEYKKEAAQRLHALPEIPAPDTTRDALKPARLALEKQKARDSMEKHIFYVNNLYSRAFGAVDSFRANGEDYQIRDINNTLSAAQRALVDATKAARLCGKRLPKGTVKKEHIEALREEIAPAVARYETKTLYSRCGREVYEFYREDARAAKFRYARQKYAPLVSPLSRYRNLRAEAIPDSAIPENATKSERAIIQLSARLSQRAGRRFSYNALEGGADSIRDALSSALSYGDRYAAGCAREYQRAVSLSAQYRARVAQHVPEKARAYWLAKLPELGDIESTMADIRARMAAENAARIVAWRNGKGGAGSARDYAPHPLLRVNGALIESSYGAYMPVEQARAVQCARNYAIRADADYRPAQRVAMGSFTLDRARVDGSIVAGCHDIPAAELDYVARILGLLDNGATCAA